MSQCKSTPSLAGIKATLTIHRAKDLLAKDRNMFGKKASSDPYVKILYMREKLAKTPVKSKTLAPEWEFTMKHNIGAHDAEMIRQSTSSASNTGNNHPSYTLVLFDHDMGSNNDVLGQVTIPITPNSFQSQWFTLQTGQSGSKYHCKKTKGQIQVSLQLKTIYLPTLIRGNIVPLQMPKNQSILKVGLGWDLPTHNTTPIDLDVSCVAVGTDGKVLMNETVYFSNLSNPNKSINHSGDERMGTTNLAQSDDKEQITMDLERLPHSVAAYVLLVTVATPGVDFSQVTSARVRVGNGVTGMALCEFRPAYEGHNTALFLMRISRKMNKGKMSPDDNSCWSLATIGDCDASARDFGSLIPEIKSYCRDLLPDMDIDPNERIAVMNKGMTVRVRDYCPQRDVLPSVVAMGLAWNVTNGVNIDLDASAVCLDKNLKLVDVVYFYQLRSRDGAIHHSGDEMEGDAVGDDEKIIVALNSVNPDVEHIVFVVNSYSGQELDDIAKASCHLFDTQTKKDLATYTLTNNSSLDKHTALLLADLYRDGITREWMLRILSYPTQGRTAKQCVGVIASYIMSVPAAVAAIPPQYSVVPNEMPVAVPLDEDVVFQPEEDIVIATPIHG